MKKMMLLTMLTLALGQVMAGETANPAGPRSTDQITGAVKQSGSSRVIRDVSVTVYEEQQGRVKTVLTDDEGSYGISTLKPGTYKIVFYKEGFRKVVREKVVVKTEGGIRLDVELEESTYELSPSPFHFFRTEE